MLDCDEPLITVDILGGDWPGSRPSTFGRGRRKLLEPITSEVHRSRTYIVSAASSISPVPRHHGVPLAGRVKFDQSSNSSRYSRCTVYNDTYSKRFMAKLVPKKTHPQVKSGKRSLDDRMGNSDAVFWTHYGTSRNFRTLSSAKYKPAPSSRWP